MCATESSLAIVWDRLVGRLLRRLVWFGFELVCALSEVLALLARSEDDLWFGIFSFRRIHFGKGL